MQQWFPSRFALTEQTAPVSEPVTTAEAKTHMRVEISDDDTYIDTLVATARRFAEDYTNRSFINTTWDLALDAFPPSGGGTIILPKSPLSSVTSISYTDTNGDNQALAASVYTADTASEPPRIVEAYNQDWPSTRDEVNAVVVRFVAGYGSSDSSVPASIKHAIKLLAAHWYENREASVPNAAGVVGLPMGIDSILRPFRVWSPYSF